MMTIKVKYLLVILRFERKKLGIQRQLQGVQNILVGVLVVLEGCRMMRRKVKYLLILLALDRQNTVIIGRSSARASEASYRPWYLLMSHSRDAFRGL